MGPSLEVREVDKTFSTSMTLPVQALRRVSLKVAPGEFVCIIGANGSGKSTLLATIAGAYRDVTGAILLDGRDVTRMPQHRRAADIAIVGQQPGAWMAPELTLEENLALILLRGSAKAVGEAGRHSRNGARTLPGRQPRPWWKFAIRRREREQFREALAPLQLGLEDRLSTSLRNLSGGQAQAIAVAAATALVPPPLLLLDEHCAALDPRMSQFVMETTDRLCRERRVTTLMVTHHLEHAARYGDRLVLMQEGRIAVDLSKQEKQRLTPHDILDVFMEHQAVAGL